MENFENVSKTTNKNSDNTEKEFEILKKEAEESITSLLISFKYLIESGVDDTDLANKGKQNIDELMGCSLSLRVEVCSAFVKYLEEVRILEVVCGAFIDGEFHKKIKEDIKKEKGEKDDKSQNVQ